MIKLKSLLISESVLLEKTFDLSKKEDAAEYIIQQAWKYMPRGEERYNSNSVFLWIDNEPKLTDMAWDIAKKFYPQDEEPWYVFQNDVEVVLNKLDQKQLDRKRAKTPSLKNPLYLLQKLMVGKSWEQAKRQIIKLSLGAWGSGWTRNAKDEEVEPVFDRLYRNAMGETFYDMSDDKHYGRVSDMSVKDETNDPHQYTINIFLGHYNNRKPIVGRVKVWRGTNNPHAEIRPGDFVTFDRGYAQAYGRGNWKSVISSTIDSKDLIAYKLDAGMSELVYWPEGHQIKKYEGHIPTFREFWEQYRFGV